MEASAPTSSLLLTAPAPLSQCPVTIPPSAAADAAVAAAAPAPPPPADHLTSLLATLPPPTYHHGAVRMWSFGGAPTIFAHFAGYDRPVDELATPAHLCIHHTTSVLTAALV
jgi:hypothetical protein